MTCPAVIVVPSVTPRTSTVLPFVTALAETGVVPLRYSVAGALVTVTFWPAGVESVKLDFDTLVTVPTVPPSEGAERAPPPPLRPAKGAFVAVVAVVVVVAAAPGPFPAVAPRIP